MVFFSPERVPLEKRHADVVVVGAGLAGLMTARQLVAAGVDVLVVEARDRVGGRTYTKAGSDGTPIDMGGQWIGPTQQRIAALTQEFGLATFPTYVEGQNIEYHEGERFLYSGAIPMHDPNVTMQSIEAMLEINIMAQEVPLDAPWSAENALVWDSQTVETWIQTHIEEGPTRTWIRLAVASVFAAEPRDISFLHLLFYVHSGGSFNELISVTRGAQETRFHEGAQQVSLRMAAELGERVLLQTPVYAILQDEHAGSEGSGESGVQVICEGLVVSAQRVVIAIPPTLAGRLHYEPQLPGHRDQLTQRMPMGSIIKVHCVYERPFWRDEGLSGQVASDSGPVCVTFDNSPESGTPGVLMGFIDGDEARIWSRKSSEERRAAVLDCLVRYFGEQARTPREYIEQNWGEEAYSRGCYVAYLPPGVWTAYGEALRAPIGRIHWAGTETATVWNGYMDGALQSGERAAAEVLAALSSKPEHIV